MSDVLSGKTVAILCGTGVEKLELVEPRAALASPTAIFSGTVGERSRRFRRQSWPNSSQNLTPGARPAAPLTHLGGARTMHFMIQTTDKVGKAALRAQLETDHRAWLDSVASQIIAAGALLQDDGSEAGGGLYLVNAHDRAGAKAFIDADPMSQAGLFEKVVIRRWRQAFLGGRNTLAQEPAQ